MAKGWIKLHRSIKDNWIRNNNEPFDKRSAWIDLILSANHEDTKIIFSGKLIKVDRGSRITSIRKLCVKWRWSNTKVIKFLNTLQEDGMITYKSDTKKTVYSICNYNDYQKNELLENDTETTQKRHRNDTETTQKHTNKNDKNDKELIKNDEEDIYMRLYPAIMQKWNKNKEILAIDESVVEYNKKSLHEVLEKYGEDNLIKAIDNIGESDWLRGLTDNSNWTITFKWFLNFENFEKVLSGYYKSNKKNKKLDTSYEHMRDLEERKRVNADVERWLKELNEQ